MKNIEQQFWNKMAENEHVYAVTVRNIEVKEKLFEPIIYVTAKNRREAIAKAYQFVEPRTD